MINLHERLSEFSYGYGVTREMESYIRATGFHVTPFLPSLLHEAELGFDVAFSGPGQVVMLQFKLGQQLSRFRRLDPAETIPMLHRPFWRYFVDVDAHQFLRLEEYESNGAQVFYVAPRFSTWSQYERAFYSGRVLRRSLLLRPSNIREGTGGTPGRHRIVYDTLNRYVCSEPRSVPEVRPEEAVETITMQARDPKSLTAKLERLIKQDPNGGLPRISFPHRRALERRARTREDAMAAEVGLEAWCQGAQVLFVTPMEQDPS